ncbi:MAG: hypothetical protein KC478_09690 [Bacteriovoracaceae bacterium]|nr:hypothetical protein [Bacteriovoracaceae bacterium]
MEIQVYRTNSSSYQDSHFFQLEKEQLESINGVKYIKSLTEINESIPFVLISNTHTEPSELPLTLLDKTVLMVHPNSGYDNFSRNFVQNVNFPIIIGNPIRSNAVAEYTLSSIFHNFTPIKNHSHWSSDRKWSRKLLRDQKALIIGFGEIGKLIYQSLSPLCAEVDVYDPYTKDAFKNKSFHRELTDELLDEKSIIIVAASLTKSSRALIDAEFLKKINNESLIVNAARGEIINEQDLIAWLKKNEKGSAYLDVFKEEPFVPGYLHELKNINKTSHIAGVYGKLNHDIVQFEKHVIKEFMEHYSKDDLEGFKSKNEQILLTENSINYL